MPRLVIEDKRTDPKPITCTVSCLGCSVTLLVLAIAIWILFNL